MAKIANQKRATKAQGAAPRRRSRISLSLRFSLLMLLAALLPLAAVVGLNDYVTRQTLIKQSVNVLPSDASVTASRINDYFTERLLDGMALSSLDTAHKFLICTADQAQVQAQIAQGNYFAQLTPDCAANFQSYGESAERALLVGVQRDVLIQGGIRQREYTLWNMYFITGPNSATMLLSSDLDLMKSGQKTPAPAQEIASVIHGQQNISPVYYDQKDSYAFVRIYTPIYKTFPPAATDQPMGFLQATLKLDKVWAFVNQGAQSDGSDSGAFILDNNGVRVADTDSGARFTSVAPLDAKAQSLVSSLGLYGLTSAPAVRNLPQVAAASSGATQQTTFQGVTVPGGQTQSQFAAVKTQAQDQIALLEQKPAQNILPWTYFLDSPIATVTAVATQQLQFSLISAAIVAVLAMLLGLFIGARTASPVEQSAQQLEGAAGVLKALASRQESAASEQSWVVDACKTGIDGVRYLADAMNQAARRIIVASNWFNDYWDRLTEEQARSTVQHLRELAAYIDEAARRQQASSDRLDKAIAVTMQVSNQLLTGATEATQSAEQLDMVVRDLQRVIGGQVSASAETRDEEEELRRRIELVTGSVPALRPGQMGQMALPAPSDGRPMGGPASGRIAARAPSFRLNPTSHVSEDWSGYNGPASQYDQYGQFGQVGQYGQYGQMGQMGQMGQHGPTSQNGQMGQMGGVNNGARGANNGGQYGSYGQYGPNSRGGGGDQSW